MCLFVKFTVPHVLKENNVTQPKLLVYNGIYEDTKDEEYSSNKFKYVQDSSSQKKKNKTLSVPDNA